MEVVYLWNKKRLLYVIKEIKENEKEFLEIKNLNIKIKILLNGRGYKVKEFFKRENK